MNNVSDAKAQVSFLPLLQVLQQGIEMLFRIALFKLAFNRLFLVQFSERRFFCRWISRSE